MHSVLHRTKSFLGLEKNIVLLLCLTLIMITAERTWERFIPKYLEAVNGSILIIGGYGFLQNLIASFWSLPGGYISDALGNKRAFLVFNLLAIGGYVVAIFFTSWVALFIGMIFFSAWNALALPASMSLITKTLNKKKTAMGISMHSIIRRFPMMLGPLLGAAVITKFGLIDGIRITFGFSVILCIVGIIFQHWMVHEIVEKTESIPPITLWRRFDPRLKNLLVSDILIRFCEQIPYVFVVLWCLNVVKISPVEFGYLTAIEMLTAAFIYIPVASFSDKLERKPFVLITFMFFTLFPLFLFFSKSFPILVIAFIIRGLKEFGEPTRKAMIMDLSVKNAEARSFGLYYFIRDFIVSFAAFAGGWLWMISPSVNLFCACAFGVAGLLYFTAFGRGTTAISISN